jgi:hypothetical protein
MHGLQSKPTPQPKIDCGKLFEHVPLQPKAHRANFDYFVGTSDFPSQQLDVDPEQQ